MYTTNTTSDAIAKPTHRFYDAYPTGEESINPKTFGRHNNLKTTRYREIFRCGNGKTGTDRPSDGHYKTEETGERRTGTSGSGSVTPSSPFFVVML
ncbi:Hypothetical protein NTJ_10840 [Nesidiocoris tenuis]|uniref:Uncharacterized protein n=1 Tax=Nesidiocoris tenuis TaxID=355587 RepID=A0ABN7B4C0_9HEMI|nr:Hypothetical protein NTJ_10840 [Nesidiocoris tenuis]